MMSPESKMKSSDRILKLEVIGGKSAINSTGMVNKDLFTGDNKLHAVMDPESCMWSFKYERGALPPTLKGNFTGFRALLKYAENYFIHRNIRITEVQD